ncbi:MAG: hypothetical protein ACK2UA_09280 [Anaerolineae bacterium]
MTRSPSDRIHLLTRVVAAIVIPFLVLAFVILYFFPDQSGERFAWAIKPHMMAMFIGAGYIGGAYLFVRTALGSPWHRVAPGFLPVTAFTLSMLVVTVLHWARFDIRHFPFQLWLILYVVTPFLVPYLWIRNRVEDTGAPEEEDAVVPAVARWGMTLVGAVIAVFALIGLISPSTLLGLWVWTLTPLTTRILSGWFSLLAVGGLTIGRETRWSAWKIGLVSIGLWHALILVAAILNPADFPGGVVNWYTVLVALGLVGMVGLVLYMRRHRPSFVNNTQEGDY